MAKYWITTGTMSECIRAIRNMSDPAKLGDVLHWILVEGDGIRLSSIYSVAIERKS